MTSNPFTQPSDIDPLFGKEEERFGNVYNGRYHMPPLDDPNAWIPGGAQRHISRGVKRSSKMASAISDTRALDLWEKRKILDGIRSSIRLQEKLMTMVDPTDAELNAFAEEAKEAGGGTEAARRGTLRHDMLEHWLTTGRETGTAFMRLQLDSIKTALREHLLFPVSELTERIIYNDEIKCAGRWDGVVIDAQTGEMKVDDLKSKRRQFWTMLEVEVQLSIYARGTAMWDGQRGCYVDMPALSLDEGYVLHTPVDGDPETGDAVTHVLCADLRRGWENALLAAEVTRARSVGKSVATLRAAVRPHPGVTMVEVYARRFGSVSSAEQGSRLVAECIKCGVWCAELADAATVAADRLAGKDLEIGS